MWTKKHNHRNSAALRICSPKELGMYGLYKSRQRVVSRTRGRQFHLNLVYILNIESISYLDIYDTEISLTTHWIINFTLKFFNEPIQSPSNEHKQWVYIKPVFLVYLPPEVSCIWLQVLQQGWCTKFFSLQSSWLHVSI